MESDSQINKLYENIGLLNELLCETLKQHLGVELLNIINLLLEEARTFQNEETFDNFAKNFQNRFKSLTGYQILAITRALSHFLNLTEIAEQYHRIHRRRWHQIENHPLQPGSLEAVLPKLIREGVAPQDLYHAVCRLKIDLVLTAHPTEVTRRSLIQKHNLIAKKLEYLDREDLTPTERRKAIENLHESITEAWLTEEIRSQRPTVIEEAKWGFAVVEESLWHALPEFMRDLDRELFLTTKQPLPIMACPVRFSSWMGGDRDGNPNVTAKVTREVVLLARWMASDLYWRDMNYLCQTLSMHECSEELKSIVGDTKEPYRTLLRGVRERLMRTKQWAECQIEQRELCPSSNLIYLDAQDLLEPLLICYESLRKIGASVVASGYLLDVIRRVNCFGLALLPLDIRQNSDKHTDLFNFITEKLGFGSYAEWLEPKRQEFLIQHFFNNVALTKEQEESSSTLNFKILPRFEDTSLQEVADVFRVVSEQYRDSFGSYVISMASRPSDILVVVALQKIFNITQILPVVPLFETLDDLLQAADCIDTLLSIPGYKAVCKGSQEIMIGYSDSAKDAGFLAASWAQYQAQEKLIDIGKKHKVQIVFFHGRGGSVGRGGGPSHLSIRSLPPNSTTGKLRVTQQGEVIRHRFGLQKIAERSLAIYCTATIEAILNPSPPPLNTWREVMNELSRVSLATYQSVVNTEPDFMEYFSKVTPLRELEKITIASRPTRRRLSNTILDLRAIPWVFAWTQNRLILPAWLGAGEALMEAEDLFGLNTLITLNNEWSYFSSILTMIEMGLARANTVISRRYEYRLAEDHLWSLGEGLRASFQCSESILLKVLQQKQLLDNNKMLKDSIYLRSSYLLSLHLFQIELLSRHRNATETYDEILEHALMVSITGIARGMHNSG